LDIPSTKDSFALGRADGVADDIALVGIGGLLGMLSCVVPKWARLVEEPFLEASSEKDPVPQVISL